MKHRYHWAASGLFKSERGIKKGAHLANSATPGQDNEYFLPADLQPANTRQPNAGGAPYRALWLSVIERQFLDAAWQEDNSAPIDTKELKRRQREKTSALIWLRGDTKHFVEVCDLGGVGPSAIRRLARNAFGKKLDIVYPGATT